MFYIRSAHDQDLEKVSVLLRQTWHATYDGIYGREKVDQISGQWHSVPALKVRFMRKGSEFVVADDGKRLGGMGYAAMSTDLPATAILHQLYVHPHFQRQGIGRDLFAELETCFPDAERLRLEVEPRNEAALAFYAGMGFVEIGKTANCGDGQSGIPALILEKELSF